jgi:hypothetical protein
MDIANGGDENSRRTSEVLLIAENDLEVLRSFDGRGSITVSAYLRLDSPQLRESAYDKFLQLMKTHLDECDPQPECREALEEDLDIIGLYLKTNGHRRHAGLAIFSCAAELFWRAYPLLTPLDSKVSIGPKFDLAPLMQVVGQSVLP